MAPFEIGSSFHILNPSHASGAVTESHFLSGAVLLFYKSLFLYYIYLLGLPLVYIKYKMVYYTRLRTIICDVLVMFICICYDPICFGLTAE